jgi:hypothetical protein
MRSANFKVQCKEAARVKPSLASTELNREGKLHDSMQKDGTANHRTNSRCIGRVASLAAEFTATRVKPGGRRTAAKAKASRCTQGCSKGNTELKSWAEPGSKSFTTQFTGDGAGKTAPPPNKLDRVATSRLNRKEGDAVKPSRPRFFSKLPSCPNIPAQFSVSNRQAIHFFIGVPVYCHLAESFVGFPGAARRMSRLGPLRARNGLYACSDRRRSRSCAQGRLQYCLASTLRRLSKPPMAKKQLRKQGN